MSIRILTLSCKDQLGIVSKVTSFLSQHQGFVLELSQYGDVDTGKFFMRCVFEFQKKSLSREEFATHFSEIAREFNLKWELRDPSVRPKVLLLVSKHGHCLNDLLHRVETHRLPIEVVAIGSNHDTFRDMAEWYKIPFQRLPSSSKEAQEAKILELIQEKEVELVVLARYMQILSSNLTQKLEGKAINIHHSFLPSFKGAKPYHQAHQRGVKLIGATAHYVSDELDEGPIIDQEVVRVDHTHDPKQLVEFGRDVESVVLARAIKYHIERRVFLDGNKTVVFKS